MSGHGVVLQLIVILLLASCMSDNERTQVQRIVDLRNQVINGESWEESDTTLLNNAEFIEYYLTAEKLYPIIEEIMRSDSIDQETKLLAVLIAQGLPFSAYMDFAEMVLQAYESDVVSERIVAYSIFPGASWGVTMVENANEIRVTGFLSRVEKSTDDDLVQARIKAIRDGSYKRYIDHLAQTGVTVPVIHSKISDQELN